MSQRTEKTDAYTLLELVTALAILFVVVSCFGVALRGIYDVEHRLRAENRGIVVLNNVLERLESERTWDASKASVLLKEEFDRSELARSSSLRPVCREESERIVVCIMKTSGKPLVGIELNK